MWNLIDNAAVSRSEMHSIEYAFEGFSLELSGRVSAHHIQLLWVMVSAGDRERHKWQGGDFEGGLGRGAPVSCPA